MEVESSLSDFNRKSNNVGRFKGDLWEKYIAHEQAPRAITGGPSVIWATCGVI